MDYTFTKEQEFLRETIRNFISKEAPREYQREFR